MSFNPVNIYDRIKEYSYTIGTGNFLLNGAVNGFSSFGSVYPNSGVMFYAATDGTFYEVGSGIYVSGVQNQLVRFPFKSTNNNNRVSFGEGLKEIYVTYPATHSVYISSGVNAATSPQTSGVAIWASPNVLSYDSNIVWNSTNSRLGIKKTTPIYAIDVGGSKEESFVRASGFIVDSSGIYFPSGNNGQSYVGGRQLAHYEPNALSSGTFSDQVLELSGVAKNIILLKQQNAGLVFAGPASGCTPPCSPDYPTFRPLTRDDIPKLEFKTITSSLDAGSTGDMCVDSTYLYIRTATGWRRISLGGAF